MCSLDSWSFFDKIYCISIDDRTDRRVEAKRQFASVGLLGRVEFVVVKKHAASPEQGCYQSHIACLQSALAAGAEHILIFEDDIIFKGFKDSTLQEVSCFLRENPNWNILFLGGIVRRSSKTTSKSVVKITYQCLSHAYAITRQFAERVVAKPWQGVPYDAFLAQLNQNFYAVYPSFSFQSNSPTDNKFFIDTLRRLLGGLYFIQKANELFQRYKTPIIIGHILALAALVFFIFRQFQ
nr:glycosyltransferase family 25 protein [Desulfobulbaceae bacterium]